jgi:CheY-like chemotaxis protein
MNGCSVSVGDALPQVGWDVFEAATGEQALALLQHEIDVLITDIHLPPREMSGWDVAEAFRAIDPNIAVICASCSAPEARL